MRKISTRKVNLIKAALRTGNVSQTELARTHKVHVNTIHRYANGFSDTPQTVTSTSVTSRASNELTLVALREENKRLRYAISDLYLRTQS